MANRLDGHVAVVTGAGRGIGEAVARRYAEEGAAVVLAARTFPEIEAGAKAIVAKGGRAVAVSCDMTSDDAVAELRGQGRGVLRRHRHRGAVSQPDPGCLPPGHGREPVRHRAGHPGLSPRHGGGRLGPHRQRGIHRGRLRLSLPEPVQQFQARCGGTHALSCWELAESGVTANAICPGFVDTPLLQSAKPALAESAGVPVEQADQVLLSRVAMDRFLQSDEIAHLAIYLGSNESGGMTSESLVISAGLVRI